MRLIDADALKDLIYESWGGDPAYHTAIHGQIKTETEAKAEYACLMLENIAAQPTIEAEPNSCEYWDSESRFCALHRPQAEPVKHGRWITVSDGYGNGVATASICECSLCKDTIWVYKNDKRKWRFCLNCGARMDEVEE